MRMSRVNLPTGAAEDELAVKGVRIKEYFTTLPLDYLGHEPHFSFCVVIPKRGSEEEFPL